MNQDTVDQDPETRLIVFHDDAENVDAAEDAVVRFENMGDMSVVSIMLSQTHRMVQLVDIIN